MGNAASAESPTWASPGKYEVETVDDERLLARLRFDLRQPRERARDDRGRGGVAGAAREAETRAASIRTLDVEHRRKIIRFDRADDTEEVVGLRDAVDRWIEEVIRAAVHARRFRSRVLRREGGRRVIVALRRLDEGAEAAVNRRRRRSGRLRVTRPAEMSTPSD